MNTVDVKNEEKQAKISILDNLDTLPNISLRALYFRIKRSRRRRNTRLKQTISMM